MGMSKQEATEKQIEAYERLIKSFGKATNGYDFKLDGSDMNHWSDEMRTINAEMNLMERCLTGLSTSDDPSLRRLAGCEISNDQDASHGIFILAPILMILMLVLFMYRRPLQRLFSNVAEKSSRYVTGVQKKA